MSPFKKLSKHLSVGRHLGGVIDDSFVFYRMLCLKAQMDLIFLWFGVIKLSTMVSGCSEDVGVVRQIFVFDRQRWLTVYWSLCLMDRTGKKSNTPTMNNLLVQVYGLQWYALVWHALLAFCDCGWYPSPVNMFLDTLKLARFHRRSLYQCDPRTQTHTLTPGLFLSLYKRMTEGHVLRGRWRERRREK